MSPFSLLTSHLWLAVALSAAVSVLAWLFRSLTRGGAVAAFLVGTIILAVGGWAGGVVLAVFFVGSSVAGRLAPEPSAALGAKGERRDGLQVLANGGAAVLAMGLEWIRPGAGVWALSTSLAAAAADTWATAAGAWNPSPPRLILTGRRVSHGTSGGITWYGSTGGLIGAATVGAAAAMVFRTPILLPAATGIGFLGMLLDSVLGASVQGRFRCPACGSLGESRVHHCGSRAVRIGGWSWVSNDLVNIAATLAAGFAGWLAWSWSS
ncbi:MAG: DUF92 domain-containing protein [Gemmatimonadales bacterium]